MRLALAATLVALTATHARADDSPCGEAELSDEALAAIAHAQDAEEGKADADDVPVQFHVPVYLHVIRRASQGEGDMLAAHARAITIDVLNQEFAAQHIPFTFDLAKIDYLSVDDATYHLVQNSAEEKAMYDAANVPGRRNLNIYLVGPRTDTSVTGWAEFLVNPKLGRGDHAVLRYNPATGGFSDRLVPVHETGHWLGLLHTFQFGCGQLAHGDLIRDTPTQATGHSSCALTTDTCPDDPGTDPVDNIMGYSHACRGTFTPGQIRRIKFLYRTVRGGKGDDDAIPDDTGAPEEDGGCTVGQGSHGGSEGALLGLGLIVLVRRRRRRAWPGLAGQSRVP